jgi:hypothetical protein
VRNDDADGSLYGQGPAQSAAVQEIVPRTDTPRSSRKLPALSPLFRAKLAEFASEAKNLHAGDRSAVEPPRSS